MSAADPLDFRQAQTSDNAWAECGLARELSELARQMHSAADVVAVASIAAEAVVRNLEGSTGAAVVLIFGGDACCTAYSDDVSCRLATVQLQAHCGPGLDCAESHRTMRSDDLRTDDH